MHTVVGRTDTCVSACVLVFASGSHLVTFPTSQIGVHRVYNIGENAYGEEIAVDTDFSILLTVKVAQTYRDWGVPDIVIDKMVATSGNNVTWIKAYEWPAIEVIQ